MENLVGRKVLCTQSYDGVTKGKEYIITDDSNNGFYIIEDDGKKQKWCTSHLDSETHLKLLIDEPQFKQGDKVLVSNNKSYWAEGEFITKYKDEFIVKTNVDIIGRKHIKPYKEEIKVGDWVVNTHHGSVFKNDTINLGINQPNYYRKITNPELIELLNNEL